MVVTAIEKTRRGRYSLFADGEFLYSIHPDSYFKTGLTVGTQMTVQQLEQLRVDDQLLSAKSTAMDILSRSSQTSGMLIEKLSRRYDEDAVAAATARMAELGLLDDTDYALRYARDCLRLKGWSEARTRQALRQKRVDAETVERALEQAREDESESGRIVRLIARKYRAKLDDRDSMRKTIAALQRRGFSYEDIKTALRRIEDEGFPDEYARDAEETE